MHYSKIAGFVAAATIALSSFGASAAGGRVTTDGLNIRSGASTGSAIVGTAHTNDILDIKGKDGNFYLLNYNGQTAYASCDYVSVVIGASGTVNTGLLNVRNAPSTNSGIIGELVRGDEIYIVDEYDGWYEILMYGDFYYVYKDYVDTDYRHTGSQVSRSSTASRGAGASIVEYGKQFLGTPYVYGGTSPSGFDCSGFTYYVFANNGISLPRRASAQAGVGIEVSRSNIQAGDLVFFNTYGSGISHVGIAVNNNEFIHATVPGDVVKISSLSASYYRSNYVTARRVVR